jgi:hypothetical protein
MDASPIRICDTFRDVMVKRGTSQLQNSDSHFPEDESERSLTKQEFEKNPKWWEGAPYLDVFFFQKKKRCTFVFLVYIVLSELS